MKASKIYIYAVVLWTLVESRHARRLGRSLDVEGKGSNLTQKQQQEVIHADVLQHFTTTPSTPSESVQTNVDTVHYSTSSLIKDVPFIPEEINVQSLKNDDHLHIKYDRRITLDKENPDGDSVDNKNKTEKRKTNDLISYKYNQTGPSSSIRSEVLVARSSYEHSSTSVTYDEDDSDHEENDETHTHEYRPVVSSTESSKVNMERKNFEAKKKEKGKKEILDSVTVSTDFNGVGRLEKPYKDNIISVKLREKNKDSISEALGERRSTTNRISNSSSVNLSEHDSNKSLGSVNILRVGSSGTNKEDSVNQSVNSVINGNGVNSDSLKKPKMKYSAKMVHDAINDTDTENSSTNVDLLNEGTAQNIVPVLNPGLKTTPTSVIAVMTSTEKSSSHKQNPHFQHFQPTESTLTKEESEKFVPPPPTSIVKPSIAFKQQLANKLKGFDPVPTVPMNVSDDATDQIQDKSSGKSSTKSSLRKKPKTEHYASSAEMYIPPTATAWTLVSLKSTSDGLRTSRRPESLGEMSSSTPADNLTTTQKTSTITPVSRVKSFVPWSSRLQKNTSLRPPTTPSTVGITLTESPAVLFDSEVSSSSSNERKQKKSSVLKPPVISVPASTTEDQSVIRTTLELDRNMTESSINLIPSSLNDVMVKDQSSTVPQDNSKTVNGATTEGVIITSLIPKEEHMTENSSVVKIETKTAERENIIETKQASEENDTHSELEDKKPESKSEEKITSGSSNITTNELLSTDLIENLNEIKPGTANQSYNTVLTTLTPEAIDSVKMKNMSEVSELDPAASDILVDGVGEEGKSGEESDEEYKPKKTTTLPPMFEPFETTVMSDLDEDVEGENDRDDEELSIIIDKVTTNQTTKDLMKDNKTEIEVKTTSPTIPGSLEFNSSGTYVTSFDIVSKENVTRVVTKTPLEGDINWYNVDTKPVNVSVEDTSHKTDPIDVTTPATMETTFEPETTTEMTNQETTLQPETTETVMKASPNTTPAPVPDQTVTLEDGTSFENVEDPTSCVRIVVHVSPLKLCHGQQQLRESIASQLITDDVSWEQVLIMSRRLQDCEAKEQSVAEQLLDVDVCFVDKDQEPSPAIRDEFLKLYTKRANDPSFPIVEVQMIVQPPTMSSGFDNVLAAIVLSVIAAICLVLLGILLVIVRKRQGRFNYGQRCTPVSLDDYSLDNISVYNSVRRKGALRASKRSYGNPAFDDPGAPTHTINFAGLANFSTDREALDEEFNQIPMITVKPDELFPGAESKNRYANVIPLPETRVLLQTKEGADHLNEYINANYIKGPKGQDKLYIACQAPLQSTVEDFWRMVWQQQTKVILMLTALNENGVEKCADYLPQLEITDCHRLFGDFQVTLKKHEVREKYIISSLQLKNLETNLWREVTHLWYSSWPSQGVPEDGSAMIAFLIEARSYMRGAQGPTVVHCSPGTGRTGTVIAIDLCIRDFETLRSVDIPKTVYALRRDRAGAVQTKDQYAFIYQVLNLYATKLTGGALDSF